MSVNRFSKEAKLAKHIVPPQVLDIRPFLENLESQLPSEYTLAAQIVHIGRSKNSGLFVFLKFWLLIFLFFNFNFFLQVIMFLMFTVKMVFGAVTMICPS